MERCKLAPWWRWQLSSDLAAGGRMIEGGGAMRTKGRYPVTSAVEQQDGGACYQSLDGEWRDDNDINDQREAKLTVPLVGPGLRDDADAETTKSGRQGGPRPA
ncbi:hypothetical protein BaRGS_00035018 [Batillaria attramentaria]|uniref:Uncharacterized protein n=1 Tax=Batillaria attramentaria TaxID=370345 RepID=A0ABD0JFX3_9CAEN